VSVWRGPLGGTGPTYALTFEESTDGVVWTTCTDGGPVDPGSDTETQYQPKFTKRWYRYKLVLAGTAPVVTTWAAGFLERRQS
jgi:hypothetical protein